MFKSIIIIYENKLFDQCELECKLRFGAIYIYVLGSFHLFWTNIVWSIVSSLILQSLAYPTGYCLTGFAIPKIDWSWFPSLSVLTDSKKCWCRVIGKCKFFHWSTQNTDCRSTGRSVLFHSNKLSQNMHWLSGYFKIKLF